MEDALARGGAGLSCSWVSIVLILVVMEDALAQINNNKYIRRIKSLNPCCNGRCTRTNTW